MSDRISCEHGFDILREEAELKLRFDRAGPNGLISFAKACIWSGITDADEIIERACAITGDHVEDQLMAILRHGENVHWTKSANGELALII